MSPTALLPRPWRLPYAGIWLAVALLLSIAALQDYHRAGGTRDWEPFLWEFSSIVCVAVLALGVHALVGRLRGQPLEQQIAAHLVGAALYATLHIVGMFALRFGVYRLADVGYEPGAWSVIAVYETAKDLVSYAIFVLISRGLWLAKAAAAQQRELEALRLARLADQIQPHFLFNTLNLVSSVMYEDVARADRLLCQLADLLRQTLAAQQRVEQSLADELALVEPFLALMQARFGAERLSVDINADAAARAALLPALLLLSPVENAIKHDVARHVGRVVVSLRAHLEAGSLVIEITSRREPPFEADSTAADDGGLGLRNLRQRLAARYGSRAHCDFEHRGDGARLLLDVPQGRA